MSWRTTTTVTAGLLMAASAQTPPRVTMPESPKMFAETDRALLELVKNYRPDKSAACSIPLTEVPVAKNVKPMPTLRPRKSVEPMPLVPLPAPPCKEEKR
jgi:hypothetical protein